MTLLVILPTYNERENLPTLVPAVLEQGAEILVADDQSPDGTGALADELAAAHPGRVHVLHRTGEKGFALSYIDGMRWAIERNYDLICQMDADWSHDPKYLPAIAEASATHDVVIGSRYVNGVSVVNWPLRRIFLSSFANWYIRCWRRAKLAEVMQADISSDGYAFQVEMLWKAARVGCRITEVPIIFVERQQGQSKLSTKVLMESLLMPWRLRVRSLLSR
jgi:dolichol-phosphate mannosyltransferase